jgi:hypothetical protein
VRGVGATGLKVATQGKIDGLFLTNLGLGVTLAVMGVPYLPALGISAAADFVEMEIRKRLASKNMKVMQPYLEYLKRIPNANSEAAAAGYSEQKTKPGSCFKKNNWTKWLAAPKAQFAD